MRSLWILLLAVVLGCSSTQVTYIEYGTGKVVFVLPRGETNNTVDVTVELPNGTRIRKNYWSSSSWFVVGDEVEVYKHPTDEDYSFERIVKQQ
jgi:hypothetical protein